MVRSSTRRSARRCGESFRTWGEGSRKWKTAVEAEFPFAADDQLVDLAWLERCASTFSARFNDAMSSSLVIAVDPSRHGSDGTGYAIRRGPIVFEVGLLPPGDLMRTTGAVIQLLRDWTSELRAGSYCGLWTVPGSYRIVVDEIGLGSGVLDRLRERGYDAIGFAGSRAAVGADLDKRYANRRAQTFWELRSRLERGLIALPQDDLLWGELVGTRWTVGSDGRTILEPKRRLRRRLKRSPDRADAVAMSLVTEVDPDAVFTYGGDLVPM